MSMLNFIKKTPLFIYLLLIVVSVSLYGDMLPLSCKKILLGLSETIKDLLVFVLPFIIFSCLFSSMLAFKSRALLFVAGFISFICVSNYLTSLLGFCIGNYGSQFLDTMPQSTAASQGVLHPAWDFSTQKWIDNHYALGLGLISGIAGAFFQTPRIQKFADTLNKCVYFFLKRIFLPVMPLFVLGFMVKMQHEGILAQVFQTYLPILGLLVVSLASCILFLFLAAAKFDLHEALIYIRRALPAGILGFSTLSSMAALPLNLEAAEKSSPNPYAARAIVPATVNNHLIGDSLTVPIIAMAVLSTFHLPAPTFSTFAIFALFLMATKFSIVAVPAGGVLVILAPLENYLGFSSEMTVLLVAVYSLFEPVTTIANVMSNNAVAILLSRTAGSLRSD